MEFKGTTWYVYANSLKPHHGRALDNAAWATLLDNFDQMAQGLDENGEVIYTDAEGKVWKFVLLFGQGDMEQLCLGWGLPSYSSIDQICGMCLADRTQFGNNYTDMQEWANWRNTCPIHNDIQSSAKVLRHRFQKRSCQCSVGWAFVGSVGSVGSVRLRVYHLW